MEAVVLTLLRDGGNKQGICLDKLTFTLLIKLPKEIKKCQYKSFQVQVSRNYRISKEYGILIFIASPSLVNLILNRKQKENKCDRNSNQNC